jgi:hypothetical protein
MRIGWHLQGRRRETANVMPVPRPTLVERHQPLLTRRPGYAQGAGFISPAAKARLLAGSDLLERGERLSEFPWPTLDTAFLASAMRWLMLILSLGCVLVLGNAALRRMRWLPSNDKVSGEPSGD